MSEKQKISVLMSVYIKENPTFLKDAIESVQNQTLKPSELVLVEDGPLTPELLSGIRTSLKLSLIFQ